MMDSNEFDWTYVQPAVKNGLDPEAALSEKKPSPLKKCSRWPSFRISKKPSFKLGKKAENLVIRAVVLAGELAGDLIPDDIAGGTQSLRCSGRKELPSCNMDCDCLV